MSDRFPEIYTQFLANTLIVGFLIGFIVLLTLFYQKRKMQQKKELELLKAEIEKEFLTARLEIQESLQRDFSMEIHDNVGQSLLLANVNISILQNQLKDNSTAQNLLKESKELIIKSMEDITSLSRSMNPDRIVTMGVFKAISIELESLQQKQLFNIKNNYHEPDFEQLVIKPEVQLMIFRIYQELIKNIIKYANATTISLNITKADTGIKMTISDDGTGFEFNPTTTFNGIGLRSIQKRVAIFNGQIKIETALGRGTSIQVTIPSHEFI